MSLVGPRPPIPYEYEVLSTLHRRRIFDAKPGITGKWQIHGRAELAYSTITWSAWTFNTYKNDRSGETSLILL